jgi:hypothetical protein
MAVFLMVGPGEKNALNIMQSFDPSLSPVMMKRMSIIL